MIRLFMGEGRAGAGGGRQWGRGDEEEDEERNSKGEEEKAGDSNQRSGEMMRWVGLGFRV